MRWHRELFALKSALAGLGAFLFFKWRDGMKFIQRMNGDFLTPVSLYLRLKSKEKFLLESLLQNHQQECYSMIALDPIDKLSYQNGIFQTQNNCYPVTDPLKELEKYVVKNCDILPQLPFQGGAIGYVGYDIAACYENIGSIPPDEMELPDLHLYLFETYVIYEHVKKQVTIICSNAYSNCDKTTLQRRCQQLVEEIKVMAEDEMTPMRALKLKAEPSVCQKEFETIVKNAKKLIAAGDMFQVVLSQRLTAELTVTPFAYYRQLRKSNPSPYMYYLDFKDYQIIGASPEILVSVKGQKIVTNPIAGTRPRGKSELEDNLFAKELLADEKERAEHMMLIDLARNDLNKVSKLGSVAVTQLMTIEKYRFVMHICSVVEGKIKKELTPMDALKAILPVGTVSGAPKIRTMQRIYQFEKVKRGVYAGAVGYYSLNNEADFAIAIRTAVVKNQIIYLQAGAGVVYDSNPTKEYFETLHKAQGLLEVGL